MRVDEKTEFEEASETFSQGVKFGREGNYEQALKTFEQLSTKFGSADEFIFLYVVAKALFNKGATLGKLDRPEEEIAAYDELVNRFSGREEKSLAEKVAMALVNKGVVLRMLDRPEQAEEVLFTAIKSTPDLVQAHIELIRLLLKNPKRHKDALRKADEIISRRPDDTNLLNSLSWELYKQKDLSLLPKAETWARQAVANSPTNLNVHHTLACILCSLGKGGEALESASKYIQDTAVVEKTIKDAIELFAGLAASGFAKEALGMLVDSPAERHLEPLVVGLKMFMGEDVQTAIEILEVAKDVVKIIEERKQME